MLLAIRERVMGIVGWVLLGFLGVAFAFFGLNSYMGDTSRPYAASVNGADISLTDLKKSYQLTMARLKDRMGKAFDPALFPEESLRKISLERLIHEELMLQEAKTDGFTATKEVIAARIKVIPAFKDDDTFSSKKYTRMLQLQGLSSSEFERGLSRELVTQQLRDGFAMTAYPTPAMVKEIYRLQAQQRRFRYLVLQLSGISDKASVSDAEIQQYYDENSKDFISPERVKLQYVELIAGSLPVDETVEEEDLRTLYEEQSELYITPEERRARHILVSLPPDSDSDAQETALAKITSLLKQLDEGASFEELAKRESDDPGSASKGGDLGYFGKGVMDPEFEASAFSLEKGQHSGIVKTAFGYHIIEVTDIKPEVVKSFEDVRDELVNDYFSQKRSDLFYEYAETLATLAFEEPDSLDGAANELGLEISTSDWLTREGGPGIGENQKVVDAAFTEDILESRNNSEPIEISDDHLVVIRVLDHEPAETKPLDAVREEAERKAHDAKARMLVRNEGEQLLEDLKSGVSMEEAAGKRGLEVSDSGYINRASGTLDRLLVQEVYRMPPVTDDHPSMKGVALASGDYAILLLDEIRDGDVTKLNATDRNKIAAEIAKIQGNTELTAVVDALRANATIIIPEKRN